MARKKNNPPFETNELRRSLRNFLRQPYIVGGEKGEPRAIGAHKWGVYIFYDYDGEPIYVGQTKEKVSGRISRHLTNQRTDAVAMSVLDPYEVFEIEIYPLPEFDKVNSRHPDFSRAKQTLDALEYEVHKLAVARSRFRAILNEKDPPAPAISITLPHPLRGRIVSEEVLKLRGHADTRTARRAQVISRLAQTIAERDVNTGLRRTLLTQASRLRSIAEDRFAAMGGNASVETGSEADDEADGPRKKSE